MTSPANASTLAGANQVFTWTDMEANLYQVCIGTYTGYSDIGCYPSDLTAAKTTTATGLPTNGSILYVRLWTLVGSTWVSNDYTYTASVAR